MRITQPGADKSNKAFMHVNRNDFKDGVIQYVDLSCVEIGTMFDMTFKFKLVTADMQPVGCVTEFINLLLEGDCVNLRLFVDAVVHGSVLLESD